MVAADLTHTGISPSLVIVGSGMPTLHLVFRLPTAVSQDTVVVDATGSWLHAQESRLKRLNITHIRSPVTQCPHQRPTALQDFAAQEGRKQELTNSSPCFAPLPSAALLQDFCKQELAKLPAEAPRLIQDTVTAITPLPTDEGQPSLGCLVTLASGTVMRTRAVVYTCTAQTSNKPSWAASGESSVPGLACADDVDLEAEDVNGKNVAVVGGGMTAAALALGALSRGAARVALIAQTVLRKQEFECDPAWSGNKLLMGFQHTASMQERRRVCRAARGSASVNNLTWNSLQAAVDSGKLVIMEHCCITNASWDATAGQIRLQAAARPLECLTYECKSHAEAEQPAGEEPRATHKDAEVSEQAADGCQELQVSAESPSVQDLSPCKSFEKQRPTVKDKGGQKGGRANVASSGGEKVGIGACAESCSGGGEAGVMGELQSAACGSRPAGMWDRVWLATGKSLDVAADPVLRVLQEHCPARSVDGYPVLTEALTWPGVPLFFLGQATLLQLGPMAGQMAGMRSGANAVAATLLKALENRLPHNAIPWLSMPEPETQAAEDANKQLQCYKLNPPSPAKVSRFETATSFDPADRPPSLPCRQLGSYSWSDEDFKVHVILQLDEPVTRAQVHATFSASSVEVWVMGNSAAHHLHIPCLFGKILPERCLFKVNEARRKVYLVLHKVSDQQWRFLKG